MWLVSIQMRTSQTAHGCIITILFGLDWALILKQTNISRDFLIGGNIRFASQLVQTLVVFRMLAYQYVLYACIE
jgi:hypothetical protein